MSKWIVIESDGCGEDFCNDVAEVEADSPEEAARLVTKTTDLPVHANLLGPRTWHYIDNTTHTGWKNKAPPQFQVVVLCVKVED